MSDLPHVFAGYIQVEEVSFTASVSEYTASKMGQNINAVTDQMTALESHITLQSVEFTTPGSYSWTVPSFTTVAIIEGCGGGGAGGSSTFSISGAGGGGAGAIWMRRVVTGLTPGGSVAVTIGAGGAPNYGHGGGAGGNTSFGSIVMPGAPGGAETNSGSPAVGVADPYHPWEAGGAAGNAAGGPQNGFLGGAVGALGGGGGAGPYGTGGAGGSSSVNGSVGAGYGAGGGGCSYPMVAGAGAGGYLRITFVNV